MNSAGASQTISTKLQSASSTIHRILLPQRKCDCALTRNLTGECEECRKNKLTGLQTKLRISELGDQYEQEADREADKVMHMEDPSVFQSSPITVQRYASGSAGPVTAPQIVHNVLQSPGQSLDLASRAFFEPRFGYDFSMVRIHTDSKASKSTESVNALAYTMGQHIIFRNGQFKPFTSKGMHLLAHELTHVLQQRAVLPIISRKKIDDNDCQNENCSLLRYPVELIKRNDSTKIFRSPDPNNREKGCVNDSFVNALTQENPDLADAYLILFGNSMEKMLEMLNELAQGYPNDFEFWRLNWRPVHPGDNAESVSRVRVATDVVFLNDTLLSFEELKQHVDELCLLPQDQVSDVRAFFVKRPGSIRYQASARALEFMRNPPREGLCLNLYDDHTLHCGRGKGNCTIGFGHLVHLGVCNGDLREKPFENGISVTTAAQLFASDVRWKAEDHVNRLVKVKLNQCQIDALVSFTFNANVGGLNKLLPDLNKGNYDAVARLIRTTATHSGSLSLIPRRNMEADMFKDCKYTD